MSIDEAMHGERVRERSQEKEAEVENLRAMIGNPQWRPIAEYDEMAVKPNAMFLVQGESGTIYDLLPQIISMRNCLGRRVTHFFPLPAIPREAYAEKRKPVVERKYLSVEIVREQTQTIAVSVPGHVTIAEVERFIKDHMEAVVENILYSEDWETDDTEVRSTSHISEEEADSRGARSWETIITRSRK